MATLLHDIHDAPHDMLDMKDLARILRVSRETARKIAAQPGFPLLRSDRTHRIPKQAFLEWVARQTGQAAE